VGGNKRRQAVVPDTVASVSCEAVERLIAYRARVNSPLTIESSGQTLLARILRYKRL